MRYYALVAYYLHNWCVQTSSPSIVVNAFGWYFVCEMELRAWKYINTCIATIWRVFVVDMVLLQLVCIASAFADIWVCKQWKHVVWITFYIQSEFGWTGLSGRAGVRVLYYVSLCAALISAMCPIRTRSARLVRGCLRWNGRLAQANTAFHPNVFDCKTVCMHSRLLFVNGYFCERGCRD